LNTDNKRKKNTRGISSQTIWSLFHENDQCEERERVPWYSTPKNHHAAFLKKKHLDFFVCLFCKIFRRAFSFPVFRLSFVHLFTLTPLLNMLLKYADNATLNSSLNKNEKQQRQHQQ